MNPFTDSSRASLAKRDQIALLEAEVALDSTVVKMYGHFIDEADTGDLEPALSEARRRLHDLVDQTLDAEDEVRREVDAELAETDA